MFCNGFQVFLQVFHTYVSSVSSAYRSMFQMLHLDVLKVDRVLHMLQRDSPTAASCTAAGVREMESKRGRLDAHIRHDVRVLALPYPKQGVRLEDGRWHNVGCRGASVGGRGMAHVGCRCVCLDEAVTAWAA
jgi:hypothetical protein